MATISVLSYGNPSITQTLANSNGAKMSIVNRSKCSPALQLKSNIGNNNTNINNNNLEKTNLNVKPNNKRPYNVMNAKKSKAFPLSETNSNIINVNPTTTTVQLPVNSAAAQRSAKLAKTLKRPLPEIDTTVLCRASGGGGGGKTKGFPLPLAVARRNARERNRVKQVNNGFAALRDRIPEEISEAFEAQGNGRGSIKKLSKVETLRMAVEYIRSLERVLGFSADELLDQTGSTNSNDIHSCNDSYQLSDTSSISALTPPHSDNISNGSLDDSDGLPDVTIIEGHQYIRIPGTNTYQLLETTIVNDSIIIYENDENIEPIMTQVQHHQHQHQQQQQQQQHIMLQQHSQPSPPIDEYTADMANDSINCYNDVYNNHILTPASISPGAYSMQSSTAGLSPALHDINTTQTTTSQTINERSFLTTVQQPLIQTQLKTEISSSISTLPMNDSALYTESLVGELPINPQYEGILTLQTKFKDEIEPLTEESMLEAMNWWNSQHSTEQITHDP